MADSIPRKDEGIRFLVISKPQFPVPPEMALGLFDAMVAWVTKYKGSGKIEQAWSYAGGGGGGGIANVESLEELDAFMAEYPFGPFSETKYIPLVDVVPSLQRFKQAMQAMMAGGGGGR